MPNKNPLSILGRIGAMGTLVENFPMSILDVMHGPTYTSIFVFFLDILRAFNVPIQTVIGRLIEKVFGVNFTLQGGIDTIYSAIDEMEIDEQSDFLRGMEYSVKGIIMALLTSIFSCSAIPEIPTKYMDDSRRPDGPEVSKLPAWRNMTINVPTSVLDFFGYLKVSPFSREGKLYYSVKGGDKYYKKVKKRDVIEDSDTHIVYVPTCDNISKLSIILGPGHADYLAKYGNYSEDELQFVLSEPISKDLIVEVSYLDENDNLQISRFTIYAGERFSEIFMVTPKNPIGQSDQIDSITFSVGDINSLDGGLLLKNNESETNGGTYIYISKETSYEAIDFWNKSDNTSLEDIDWGSAQNIPKTREERTESSYKEIEYEGYDEVGGPIEGAKRVNAVPNIANPDDPEYIVCFFGADENTLYKSDDMNAFLWYAMNRSSNAPQVEVNKTMWDSRITAKNLGVERGGPADWNNWYNSKTDSDGHLNFQGDASNSALYPILQIKRYSGSALSVQFPAQRYYKPKATNSGELLRFNASIYRFNWEYLENIRIFNPKVLLYGMVDGLLDGALSIILSIRPNFTKKETMAALSNAIKKYIEAEDTSVEDCYFSFSNDEYEKMLQEMILSRYNATYTGGEPSVATTHDINSYLQQLDAVNFSANQEGNIEKITKLVNDISISGKNQLATIDYGIEVNVDENWWKKVIWALVMPIVEAIFTPQVILLFLINFEIMGIVSLDDVLTNMGSKVVRYFINKIFSMIASIISFIKDKLVEILWELFVEYAAPIIVKYELLKLKEAIEDWIILLVSVATCLPTFKFRTPIGMIDEVNYADIIKEQNKPESKDEC